MNSLIETLNQFGGQFLQLAWPMLWQSSLLIGFVLALDFLLARKIRASVRYALWLAVLVKLLLPPTLALPTGAAWWLFHAQPAVKTPAIKNYTVTYDTTSQTPFVPSTVALPPPPPPRLNGSGWALLATGVISAGLLLWLALRWWQVTRMVRGAMASEDFSEPLNEALRLAGAPVCDRLLIFGNLRRADAPSRSQTGAPLRIKIVEERMSPAVCGLFRPVILLPRTLAEQLSSAQLRAVLLHEAFHLRRKDVWVNCAQALLQIVYWWHPLLWIANVRIRRVREEAVDDAVMLALRDEADSYAPTLLEVAKLAFRRPLMSLGLVGIMESRSALRQRIERLVDFRAPRKAGLTLASLCGICVFSAVALPMGEAPNSADNSNPPNAIGAAVTEEQSLTLQVNPEIFFRNLKAQAPNVMQSPTNNWSDVLMELLRDEGVDCNPPHGLVFTNATGDITTQNTPEQLAVFSRVIGQLNRADGKCELPLRNNPLRKNVLIEGRIYPMSDGEFDQFTSGLHHYSGKLFGDDWWSVPPDMFKQFVNDVEASGLRPIRRPRIQTSSGIAAELYVGDRTNGLDLTCRPVVGKGFVELTLASTVVSGAPANAVTNHVSSKASAEDRGGIVLRMKNYGGQTGSNLVVVISTEILTNLPSPLHERLQTVIQRGPTTTNQLNALIQDGKLLYEDGKLDEALVKFAKAHLADPSSADAERYIILITGQHTNNSGKSYSGRQEIIARLHSIRLPQVGFESTPLTDVLRYLSQQSKQSDSQKKGINFYLSTDPDTGQSGRMASSLITIDPPLTNVPLGDVLDAVVRGASEPIYYSVQDFAISFWPGKPSQPLEPRIFKVDTNVFPAALLQQAAQSGFVLPDDAVNRIGLAFRHLSTAAGVNWYAPGKRVVYNAQRGWMEVTATAEDLRVLRQLIAELNKNKPAQPSRADAPTPQIHIKARFIEVRMGTAAGFGQFMNSTNSAFSENFTGILNAGNFKAVYDALELRKGVEILAEPEVTTTSGRQTQARSTDLVTILTNFVFEEFPTNHDGSVGTSSVTAKTDPIETGPIFDVVPHVLSDGYTLDLQMTASSMEFYGYASIPTNMPPLTVTTSTGETVGLARVWPAVLRYQKSAHVNLFDGQTVILSLTNPEQVRFGEPNEKREAAVAKLIRDSAWHNGGRNDILVFVTATIVDPAGNRVHSDDDLRFANNKIPSQPQKTVSGYFDDMNPNEQRSGRTQ